MGTSPSEEFVDGGPEPEAAVPIFLAGPRRGVDTAAADQLHKRLASERQLRMHRVATRAYNRITPDALDADSAGWETLTTSLRKKCRHDKELRELTNRALSCDLPEDVINSALTESPDALRSLIVGALIRKKPPATDGRVPLQPTNPTVDREFLRERVAQNRATAQEHSPKSDDVPDNVFKDFQMGSEVVDDVVNDVVASQAESRSRARAAKRRDEIPFQSLSASQDLQWETLFLDDCAELDDLDAVIRQSESSRREVRQDDRDALAMYCSPPKARRQRNRKAARLPPQGRQRGVQSKLVQHRSMSSDF